MKAPNKIYFPADGLPRYIDWDGSPIRTKQVEDSDICYIRKDALMEWANKALSIQRDSGNDYFIPAIVVLNDLIDKLNSM